MFRPVVLALGLCVEGRIKKRSHGSFWRQWLQNLSPPVGNRANTRSVGKAARRRDLRTRRVDGRQAARGLRLHRSRTRPTPACCRSGVEHGAVADDIVAAWYSGTYEISGGLAVAGFIDALLWNTLDFTKPPGECGDETGYWADPPP
jgi:hypothetical protein